MQTFGKRQYNHVELDPWVKRPKARDKKEQASSIPASRIAGYLVALVMVGVIAVAGFEMLVLA